MDANAAIFAEWLGVRPLAGRTLAMLYGRAGEVVPYLDLYVGLGTTGNGLSWAVQELRAAMPEGAYKAHRSKGYELTEIGIEECRAALAEHGRRIAA